jgi:hypothetical protein
VRNGVRLGALATCAALAAPASALAATQLSITPKITGKLGGNGAIAFTLKNTDAAMPVGLPSPMTAPFVAHLPAGITYNVSSFDTCPQAVINAATGSQKPNCPPGSRIGTGTATLGAVLGGQPINETAKVYIFLTRKSPVTIGFWGNGTTPILETIVFSGTLSRDAAPYGQKLTVQVPDIGTVPGGPNASTLTFVTNFSGTHTVTKTITVKKGGRKIKRRVKTTVSEFTLPKKCKGAVRWAGTATYEDGTSSSATATTACPKK